MILALPLSRRAARYARQWLACSVLLALAATMAGQRSHGTPTRAGLPARRITSPALLARRTKTGSRKERAGLKTTARTGSRTTPHLRSGSTRVGHPRQFRDYPAPTTATAAEPTSRQPPPALQLASPAPDLHAGEAVPPPPEVTPAGSAGGLTPLPPAPDSPFLYASALDPFFRALAAEQAKRAEPDGKTAPDAESSVPELDATVRVLQFGDSHTAADIFTGAVRARLQAHFGDGGLGFQYPGHPFAGYHLAGSTRSQSSGWVTEGNRFTQLGDGELGLGGISLSTHRPGETVSLSTTCTTLQVEFLKQPGGGRLQLSVDGVDVSEIDTGSSDTGQAAGEAGGTLTYSCTAGLHNIQLTTLDAAPVRLFGLVTEQPGITYECLGINGAVAPLILRWNQPIFSSYLRQRDPALIVLAYGTNEAVYIASHAEEYAAQFRQILALLHRVAPAAAILVLGPYDRAVRTAAYTVGRGRHRHTVYSWHTFAGTERINAIQRESCRTGGCVFYDEQARMGGAGSMLRWASEGLAQADHTHLTGAGYRTLADALAHDLLEAYTRYQQQGAGSLPASHAPQASNP